MEFIEAPLFTKLLPEYLDDDDYQGLQLWLARTPDDRELIPATGGFRKLRWPDRRRGKGKRGGLRVIYYYFTKDSQIWFVTLYDKNEMADWSPDERRILKAAIEEETRQRTFRQTSRRK